MTLTTINPSVIQNPYPIGAPAWDTLVGASNLIALSDDDDLTYLALTGPTPSEFSFTLADTGLIAPGATDVFVAISSRSSQSASYIFQPELSFRLGDGSGSSVGSSGLFLPIPDAPPQVYTWNYPTNRAGSAWAVPDLYTNYFVIRGARGDVGFTHRCHKTWLTVGWSAPIVPIPALVSVFNITTASATIRSRIGYPLSTPTVPTIATVFWDVIRGGRTFSKVIATITSGGPVDSSDITPSTANPAPIFDTDIDGLVLGTTYYVQVEVTQLGQAANSSSLSFTTGKRITSVMSF